jgi:hypothetical protein
MTTSKPIPNIPPETNTAVMKKLNEETNHHPYHTHYLLYSL